MTSRQVIKIVLTIVGVMAFLYFLYLIRNVLTLFFIAGFLAIALAPLVEFLNRKGAPRVLSIFCVYLGLLLSLTILGFLVVPPVVTEVDKLADNLPGYIEDLKESKTLDKYDQEYQITEKLQKQAENLPAKLGAATGALQAVTIGVFSTIFQLITVLVMAFFLLLDGKKILRFLVRQVETTRQKRLEAVLGRVSKAVGGYVAGALTISLIASTATLIVLKILGTPFAVPLAVLMGFMVLIPMVGSAIAGVIIAIVTALSGFPTDLIVWGIFFIVYQQLENNVLQPFIYKKTVALHPLIVIVAVLIGASLLGVLGALVAIPLAATVQIIAQDWWEYREPTTASLAQGSEVI